MVHATALYIAMMMDGLIENFTGPWPNRGCNPLYWLHGLTKHYMQVCRVLEKSRHCAHGTHNAKQQLLQACSSRYRKRQRATNSKTQVASMPNLCQRGNGACNGFVHGNSILSKRLLCLQGGNVQSKYPEKMPRC
jgi:hypothetical protein